MSSEHKSCVPMVLLMITACVFMIWLVIWQDRAMRNAPWSPNATYVTDYGHSERVMVMHEGRGYFKYRNQDGRIVTAWSGRLERD